MLENIKKISYLLLAVIFLVCMVSACHTSGIGIYIQFGNPGSDNDFSRYPNTSPRKVFIYAALGYNNLTPYLEDDTEELASNYLPTNYWNDNVVLVFSHTTYKGQDYTTPTSPVLTRLYKDYTGEVKKDTLLIMDKGTVAASAEVIEQMLSFVKEEFPAAGYGMLISSHGTGWTPADYCTHPERYDQTGNDSGIWMARRREDVTAKPFLEDLSVNGEPAVKGIGVHNTSKSELIEMEITDLAQAIPMKMEYIIFDACFMGGVEVAYELKDVCDKIVFSQTEIIADGMDYTTMGKYLLLGLKPDLIGLSQNYFDYYNNKQGSYKSATISLIDCTKLDELAQVCKDIFESQREEIASLEGQNKVQRYYRYQYKELHQWFFDLEDIIIQSEASQQQLDALTLALADCVIYKAATERFMNDINITHHSGLSMYLPYKGRAYLNNYYKTLKWNKATGLVQ